MGYVGQVLGHPLQDLAADVLVDHLPASKPDRDLDLVSLDEELSQSIHLSPVIVHANLGAEIHLLGPRVRLALA